MPSKPYRIVFLAALVFVFGSAWLLVDANRYLYPGAFRFLFSCDQTPPQNGTEESFIMTSDNVRLRVWRDYAPNVGKNGKTVMIFGGDDGDVRYQAVIAGNFLSRNYNVIRFDYRGYGGSKGFPSQAGIEKDASAVGKLFTPIAEHDRYIWGVSFGTYPALFLATKIPVHSLTLVAPYTDFPAVDAYEYTFPWLVRLWWPQYSLVSIAPQIKPDTHVTIYFGENDTLIPALQSQKVGYELKRVLPNAVDSIGVKDATHRTIVRKVLELAHE